MESKFFKILGICLIIVAIYKVICPYILGPEIDREYLKNIDTEAITAKYTSETSDYIVDEETGTISSYFEKYEDNHHLIVMIDVLIEKKYSENAKIDISWCPKSLLDSDSVIKVKKDNVLITILDFTKEMRSSAGVDYLKEILNGKEE